MLHEITVSEFLGDIKTNKQNPIHSETFVGPKYFWVLCVQGNLNVIRRDKHETSIYIKWSTYNF